MFKLFKPFAFRGVRFYVTNKIHVAVVGSGPSGFYTSKYLLKEDERIHISMIEKLPTPFGLVRFGVAPDHPEVKSVINDFSNVAMNERFTFFGNTNVGKDVSINELRKMFNIVILSYGASSERKLNIKGEDLFGVESARDFVNWYNALPYSAKPENTQKYNQLLKDAKNVVIIGQGNVALDVARILAKNVDDLKMYDIPDYALNALQDSNVENIFIVGRRGPIQAACTTKELKELDAIPNTKLIIKKEDLELDEISKMAMEKEGRARKRLYQTMEKISNNIPSDQKRKIQFEFFKNPIEFIGDKKIESVKFEITTLDKNGNSIGTGTFMEIPCQLVFKSIGYKSIPIPNVPFDEKRGIIPNEYGRVLDDENIIKGLYVSGWLKRGPSGIIGTNIICAKETVESILQDLQQFEGETKKGNEELKTFLENKNIPFINFEEYKKLEEHEIKMGKMKGKTLEKVYDIDEMIKIAKQ